MLNKLFHDGIEGDMWILLRNIYQDLSLKVKWNNETSESINILQGVRQGAKLSSLLYKQYNNNILNAISTCNLGAKLGNIHVGSPTCADDIALLGEQSDIQAMLGIIEFHTKRDIVEITPDKSEIMCVSKGSKQQSQSYNFNGKEIKRVEKLKHLETLEHFLLHCLSLSDVRQRYMDKLFKLLREIERGGTTNVINNELLLKIILDCSALDIMSNQPIDKLLDIERKTQDLCYQLHMKRTQLLCDIK
ncbi:unnamed protein product [Mytilus coruscus]|uniref:Reverse transcriptase domain-containing protein n=1 Tax=Mytilus coruscus TaxID=42192 RepID=A0A6J8CM54_MYTCO|nr:unnamed protein product [Mytilus coruscus]